MKKIKPNTHSLTIAITNISLTGQILYKTVTYCKKGCPWPKCKCKYQPNDSSLGLQFKNYAFVTHSTLKIYIQMNGVVKKFDVGTMCFTQNMLRSCCYVYDELLTSNCYRCHGRVCGPAAAYWGRPWFSLIPETGWGFSRSSPFPSGKCRGITAIQPMTTIFRIL